MVRAAHSRPQNTEMCLQQLPVLEAFRMLVGVYLLPAHADQWFEFPVNPLALKLTDAPGVRITPRVYCCLRLQSGDSR